MVQILGISGRKGSGKNTAANFIIGCYLDALHVVRKEWIINPQGMIWISDFYGDEKYDGVFDLNRQTEGMQTFLEEQIYPYVKLYSFADLLKTEVCMKVLGLTHEQCYGTNAQKNTLTALGWEDMPGITTNKKLFEEFYVKHLQDFLVDNVDAQDNNFKLIYHESGCMTAREVMQHVGTDIFRKMYGNVWVDATIRKIEKEQTGIAIITDCRFPNEVEGTQNAGGKVLRLTRNPCKGEDVHISETALDEDKFDWNKFDFILDNDTMSIPEQNAALFVALEGTGYLPDLQEDTVNAT